MRASADLKTGTELTFSYLPDKMLGQSQREFDSQYRDTWGFVCDCELCLLGREVGTKPKAVEIEKELSGLMEQEQPPADEVRTALEKWHSFIPQDYKHVPKVWMWQVYRLLEMGTGNGWKDNVDWALGMLEQAGALVLQKPGEHGLPLLEVKKWGVHHGPEVHMMLLVASFWEVVASRSREDVDPEEARRHDENSRRAKVYAATLFIVAGGDDDGTLRAKARDMSVEDLMAALFNGRGAYYSA